MDAGSNVNFFATTCTTWVGFSGSALEFPSEPTITIAMTARNETLRLIASPHHNLTGHPRVKRAEVRVGSRCVKSMGKPFVGVEHGRLELSFGADDVVRHVVV